MDFFIKGGPIMFFILVCSIISVAIIISKIIQLHKGQIDINEFMAGLRNELTNRRIAEAVGICEGTPGPVASILKTGIIHYEDGKISMESAMGRVSIQEIARMERGVTGLATIALVSPLFGLLGTILGLINTFQKMVTQEGLLTTQELAVGIWQSLLTTAFGITVAIPVYIAYNYLVSRINRITRDMEAGATELVGILAKE